MKLPASVQFQVLMLEAGYSRMALLPADESDLRKLSSKLSARWPSIVVGLCPGVGLVAMSRDWMPVSPETLSNPHFGLLLKGDPRMLATLSGAPVDDEAASRSASLRYTLVHAATGEHVHTVVSGSLASSVVDRMEALRAVIGYRFVEDNPNSLFPDLPFYGKITVQRVADAPKLFQQQLASSGAMSWTPWQKPMFSRGNLLDIGARVFLVAHGLLRAALVSCYEVGAPPGSKDATAFIAYVQRSLPEPVTSFIVSETHEVLVYRKDARNDAAFMAKLRDLATATVDLRSKLGSVYTRHKSTGPRASLLGELCTPGMLLPWWGAVLGRQPNMGERGLPLVPEPMYILTLTSDRMQLPVLTAVIPTTNTAEWAKRLDLFSPRLHELVGLMNVLAHNAEVGRLQITWELVLEGVATNAQLGLRGNDDSDEERQVNLQRKMGLELTEKQRKRMGEASVAVNDVIASNIVNGVLEAAADKQDVKTLLEPIPKVQPTLQQPQDGQPPVKRGRGRPRKNPPPEQVTARHSEIPVLPEGSE